MAGEEQLRRWAAEKMGALLQMPPDSCAPIVENILGYDDAAELKSFLAEFTEKSAELKVNNFVEELFAWRAGAQQASPPPRQQAQGGGGGGGGGGAGRGDRGGDRGGRGGGEAEGGGKGRVRGRGRGRDERAGPGKDKDREFPGLQMPMYDRLADDRRRIVIDAASGRYKVLTNCLNCGKVVVEEEGWGPCLFCGNPLEHSDNYGLKRGDDRGFLDTAGMLTIEEEKYNASFERAKATKDRLLSYDRDAKKRTKVYDDATDWYSESTNAWLTEKQREEAQRNAVDEERKKREEKRRIHAKIDLFGRTVISADAEVEEEQKAKRRDKFQDWTEQISDQNKLLGMMQEESRGMGGKTSQLSGDSQVLYEKLRASLHASGKELAKRGFKPNSEKEEGKKSRFYATKADNEGKKSRFYATKADNEDEFSFVSESDFTKAAAASSMGRLLPVEESPYGDGDDTGQCLSMHQPWASLLVHGFKRAEGRAWRTEHRGRLWIHAAGKVPEDEEIELLEQTYRSIYEAQGVPLPPMPSQSSGYPTSVLLGCVDLEACWTNSEYAQMLKSNSALPQEDNDNEYIFWCLRPRRLGVPLKMGGDHKIWRLPKMSLAAAQRGLQPVRWPAPKDGEAMMNSPGLPEDARRTAAAARSAASSSGGAAPPAKAAPPSKAASAQAGDAAPSRPPPPRALDLWPVDAPSEVLEVVARDRDGADRDAVVLQNGFVHLVGFVPMDVQQRIIDTLREIGVTEQGFATEQFDGIKVSTNVNRMYMGLHWNTMSKTWEAKRGNIDGSPVAELPKMFKEMYEEAVKRANRELTKGPNKKRKLTPFAEGRLPSLGVANFYAPDGTMQIHQDTQESKASKDAGCVVMGICIGGACEFSYSNDAPGGDKKPKVVRLESGDVYLFGGESRLLWHGVTRILPRTSPPSLRLIPGRLNVTLRVN